MESFEFRGAFGLIFLHINLQIDILPNEFHIFEPFLSIGGYKDFFTVETHRLFQVLITFI